MVAPQDEHDPDHHTHRARFARTIATRPRLVETLVIVGFVALLALTMWRHEMWRDELQAWTITNSSSGLRDLLHNLRYEGHPVLWYLFLFPITRGFDAPEAMQVLQFVIAVGAISLLVLRSPFTLLQRALLPFGFFLAFEFGTMSRGYGLGMLLIFSISWAANKPERCWSLIGSLIALLSLTSAFGALIGLAILAGLVVDVYLRSRIETSGTRTLRSVVIGVAIALGGMIVAYAQSIPPHDAGEYRGWRTNFHLGDIASTTASVWRAFIPIAKFQREFWNTNVTDGRIGLAAIASLGLLAATFIIFRSKPAALTMWIIGVAATMFFMYAKIGYASSGRHFGHIFLLLVATFWIAPSLQRISASDGSGRSGRSGFDVGSQLFTGVLVIQLLAGFSAIASDLFTPFSDGKAVAGFISESGNRTTPIIGYPDTAASAVAGYLQRDIYFQQGSRSGNYVIWDTGRLEPTASLEKVITQLAASDTGEILLLRTKPLAAIPPGVELLKVFADGIVKDEHFWLYVVHASAN